MKLRVFYGFTKLTKKIVREPELSIFYENSYNHKNEEWVKRRIEIVYIRLQTPKEVLDGVGSNRMFTKYGYIINKRPFKGNIDLVLERNFLVESNVLSLKERNLIRDLLKKKYFAFYKIEQMKSGQQALIFD